MIKIDKREFYRFSRFIIVGISNTIITLSIIFLLLKFSNLDYRISNIIGYSVGITNSFIWNKMWTFQSNNKVYREMFPFVLMALISYGFNLGVVIFTTEVLSLNQYFCQILGMILYTVTNYIGNKYWVFSKVQL